MSDERNLRFIGKIRKDEIPFSNPWDVPEEHQIKRDEWLTRQMLKFFSESEVAEVLTYRRSDFSDEALIADFMSNEQKKHNIPFDMHTTRAINLTKRNFKPNRKLYPVSLPDERYYPWKLSVSAEAPWTNPTHTINPKDFRNVDAETLMYKVSDPDATNKLHKLNRKVKVSEYLKLKQELGIIKDNSVSFHNLYNEIFVYNRLLIHKIKDKQTPFWSNGKPMPYEHLTLHARAHVVGKDEPDKIRAVYGAPKLLLMAELMFIWPLQATYLNTKAGKLLWGREMSRGGWKKLQQEIYSNGPPNTFIGMDWSQFDKRLLHELINIVHDIWRSYFDFSSYEPTSMYPNSNPNPERIENLWTWMCNSIKETPILLPNGELWIWLFNGFGSGFQQTQLMDSFSNAIMIYTCLSAMGINIEANEFWALFQGDDSIIAFFEGMFIIYGIHFLDMLAEAALYYFNAKLNVSKSQIQNRLDGMSVLRYFNDCGLAYRTELDLLSHLFFPERPQDFGRLAASAAGLAQASLGCSRRFYDLCRTVFEKIVEKEERKYKRRKPRWQVLRWLERVGQEEILNSLKAGGFPDFMTISEMRYAMIDRSDSECQRQWPTRPNVRPGLWMEYGKLVERDFYFLRPV